MQNYISFNKKDLPTSTALERDVKAHGSLPDDCSMSSTKQDQVSVSKASPSGSQQSAEMCAEHFPAPVLALEEFSDDIAEDNSSSSHPVDNLPSATNSLQNWASVTGEDNVTGDICTGESNGSVHQTWNYNYNTWCSVADHPLSQKNIKHKKNWPQMMAKPMAFRSSSAPTLQAIVLPRPSAQTHSTSFSFCSWQCCRCACKFMTLRHRLQWSEIWLAACVLCVSLPTWWVLSLSLWRSRREIYPSSEENKSGGEVFRDQLQSALAFSLEDTGLENSAAIRPFTTKISRLAGEKILLVDSLATESCRLADKLATKLFFKADNADADRTW